MRFLIISPREALKTHFGYDQFRLGQEEIIRTVLSGRDTFVLMPTGGGKSLCFQLPALMLEGTAIVVSPLIALMQDQVSSLKAKNIKAEFINSTVSRENKDKILKQLKGGQLDLLYLSPEKLFWDGDSFLHFLKQIKISLFVIDEAHCISRWGYDFRPDYLNLARLKEKFPDVPTVALTATADQDTKEEIIANLKLNNAKTFVFGFDRPNIFYQIKWAANDEQIERGLLRHLKHHPNDAGIIYTFTRLRADYLADRLTEEGFSAKSYHAGLSRQTREQHQKEFMKGKVKRIVATTAFGMGVDKSDVRFVFHTALSRNIEDYYQETGRAGRDGNPSEAILCYRYNDPETIRKLIVTDHEEKTSVAPNPDGVPENPDLATVFTKDAEKLRLIRQQKELEKFEKMVKLSQIKTCRRRFILQYFGEENNCCQEMCDNCSKRSERARARQRLFVKIFKHERKNHQLSPV